MDPLSASEAFNLATTRFLASKDLTSSSPNKQETLDILTSMLSLGRRRNTHQGMTSSLSMVTDDLHPDIKLFETLFSCIEEISLKHYYEAIPLLEILFSCSTIDGSPSQRLVAYLADALTDYLHKRCPPSRGIFIPSSPLAEIRKYEHEIMVYEDKDEQEIIREELKKESKMILSFLDLGELSPINRFSDDTVHPAIVDIFEGKDRVHVIDLDVMGGTQWKCLLELLNSRPEGKPNHVRITGIGIRTQELDERRNELRSYAVRLGISFKLSLIEVGEMNKILEKTNKEDSYVVYWAKHALYTDLKSDTAKMYLLERMTPKLLLIVEQSCDYDGTLAEKFMAVGYYYSGLLDALDDTMSGEYTHRYEKQIMWREIRNVLIDGVGLNITNRLMKSTCRFTQYPIPNQDFTTPRGLFRLAFGDNTNFSTAKDKGEISGKSVLAWHGKRLVTVSTWVPWHPSHEEFPDMLAKMQITGKNQLFCYEKAGLLSDKDNKEEEALSPSVHQL